MTNEKLTVGQLIDGKAIATTIKDEIKIEIAERVKNGHTQPGLAVVKVGHDPASEVYVRNKRKACEQVGIHSIDHDLESDTTEDALLTLIHQLNAQDTVHGILVQLPLPSHIDENKVIDAIDPKKDVDGFHPYNIGRLLQRRPLLRPCTPYGVMMLLQHSNIDPEGMHAVVVGASNIVGRPMSLELLYAKATVTVCHSKTTNLAAHVRDADLLVVGIGRPDIIQSDWIKPGSVVIDVGINRSPDGKLIGDVDFESARQHAGWITPVPGGVGPMTVAMLMKNTLLASTM